MSSERFKGYKGVIGVSAEVARDLSSPDEATRRAAVDEFMRECARALRDFEDLSKHDRTLDEAGK